jgi:glyoxylate reductase
MKIFVTRKVPLWDEISKPLFDAGHEVAVYGKNKTIAREELERELEKGYDGILTLLNDKIDEELLKHDVNNQLKVIANYTVGYDNINVEACTKRNIKVSNAPSDEVNESVAEFTWAMILALARRLNEAGEFMRNAAYKGWDPEVFLGTWVSGKTLGLVGMGRIGGMVARRAAGFGVKVVYYNRKPSEGVDFEYIQNLDELLAMSDYISLHIPLTPETTHIINGKNLAKVKKGAFLINTARGPVVDEVEVVEALRAGFLSGYAADVFENEPDPHPELLQMENVFLTPHIASATVEARRAMGNIAVSNLLAGLSGQNLPNLVTK